MTLATAAAPPGTAGVVQRRLQTAGRRFWTQYFIGLYGPGLLWASWAVLVGGVVRFLTGRPVWDRWFLDFLVWFPPLLALGETLRREGTGDSLERAALRLDRLAPTHDRFHTAFTLVGCAAADRTPVEELALAECTRFVDAFDLRRAIPLRFPWKAAYVPVPLIAYATLALYGLLGIGQPPRDSVLEAAISRRADTLEKIADRLRREPNARQPDFAKISEEMQKSAEHLKHGEHQTDAERLKTALKEMSSLEALLNAMKNAQQDGKISPGELSALAAALAASEQSRAAAEALKNGHLEQAAGELEKLLEQLQQQGNDSQALQQLAQSMQEQAAKLSEQEKNEVARQMQQAAQAAQSGEPQLGQQALQRLADLLKRAGQNGQGKNGSPQQQASNGNGGQPMTQKQLQDLINSLENMKDGLRPGNGDGQSPGQPQEGPGGGQESLALVESFDRDPSGNPNPGQQPSGMPGSERDVGHPDKLYGEKPFEPAKQGAAKRLEGLLGDGESLQELTAAGGDGPAKAGRRYKELYDAMAPAAQETVEQENIPLGSRFYIRRYFENIRPKE